MMMGPGKQASESCRELQVQRTVRIARESQLVLSEKEFHDCTHESNYLHAILECP